MQCRCCYLWDGNQQNTRMHATSSTKIHNKRTVNYAEFIFKYIRWTFSENYSFIFNFFCYSVSSLQLFFQQCGSPCDSVYLNLPERLKLYIYVHCCDSPWVRDAWVLRYPIQDERFTCWFLFLSYTKKKKETQINEICVFQSKTYRFGFATILSCTLRIQLNMIDQPTMYEYCILHLRRSLLYNTCSFHQVKKETKWINFYHMPKIHVHEIKIQKKNKWK